MHDQGSAEDINDKKKDEIIVSVDANIADLIPAFLERQRRVVPHWHDLIAREDYDALGNLGHDLAGTGGAFGFSRLSEIGDSLQLAAEKMNHKEVRTLVEEYSSYLGRVKVVYR